MGMAAGRAAAMVASSASASASALLLLLLLAGGAHADCFNDCFNDCMPRNRNNKNYCGYACDKVCNPDADARTTLHQRPLAAAVVVGPAALADRHHHHPLDKKQDADDAVQPAAALPDHPFHETHGVVEPDPGHGVVRPARVPVVLP